MERRHTRQQTAATALLLLALSPALAAQGPLLDSGRTLATACTQSVSLPPPAPALAPPGGFRFPAPPAAAAEVTRLQQVADGVYAIINLNDVVMPDLPLYGGNAAVILTDEGVVLVDAKTEAVHEELLAKLRSLTDAPIKYLILSHNHADHSAGTKRLQELGATVISSVDEAQRLAATTAAVPQIGYQQFAELSIGGQRMELIQLCGHTSADTVVWLPEARVLIAGDLVTTPDAIPQITNYDDGGSWTDMVLALDALAKLDFDFVIGGHGPVLTRQQFLDHRVRITAIRQRAQALVEAGSTDTQLAQALATEFNWGGPGPAAGNVTGMQAEFAQKP
ncbi:MAG TPA: MBL fold metallo-hydrolase [Pseudomonadaceae bacterium]|nr:MBL fold metallo-hydrolase [Pseudomonadaceae bacterium]